MSTKHSSTKQITNKTIIFDFNGTLVDTYEIAIDCMNKLSTKYNFPILNKKELTKLRDKTLKNIIKEDLKLKWYQFPFFLRNVQKIMKEEISKVNFHKDLIPVLKTLSINNQIFILSSNRQEIIERELKKYKIDFVKIIYSNSSMFRKDKSILNLIQISEIKKENALYVGDEVRDIEACKKINLPIISVTWGFNSKKLLSTYSPDYLIDKPEELLQILK